MTDLVLLLSWRAKVPLPTLSFCLTGNITMIRHTSSLFLTGDEYDYLIMTTVRSQPVQDIKNPLLVQPDNTWLREHLGFLTDTHQINVGITRAKHGLIIVGEWSPFIIAL